jgi:hypothetical protein
LKEAILEDFVERANNNVDGDFLHQLQSRKEYCLTSTNLTMIMMERSRWMSSPGFEISTSANEFLNCCNRYRNEPLGADKNFLDWWKAKMEE